MDHQERAQRVADKLQGWYENSREKTLRFDHGGSNAIRTSERENQYWVDISDLSNVVAVDPKQEFAVVEPGVAMDELVEQTLSKGLVPPVVPEFPGITVGGAVQGGALESSSFRHGQVSDCCSQYEIITPKGKILKVSAKEHNDLFYGTSGAYGSLGMLSLITIDLVPADNYVKVTYEPVSGMETVQQRIRENVQDEFDYVEAILFEDEKDVVITGKRTNASPGLRRQSFSEPSDPWFYRHAKDVAQSGKQHAELVPITEYLFRYNIGAFWMGEYFFDILHLPRSDGLKTVLNPFMNTRKLYDGLHHLNLDESFFIQDVYLPFENAGPFIEYMTERFNIFPIWLCPIKSVETPQKLSPHYIDDELLLDVGVWGTPRGGYEPEKDNRDVERFVRDLNGRKMLYADQYYEKDEFWDIYDKDWYESLRERYDATCLPTVYEKTVVSHKQERTPLRGAFKLLWETLKGKHINT